VKDFTQTEGRGGDPETDPELLRWVWGLLTADGYRGAALWLTAELAGRFECERVSLGFAHRGRMQIEALSFNSRFDPRSTLARDLAEAMHEACDQDAAIVSPASPSHEIRVTRAHERLADAHGTTAVCSIPLAWQGRAVGALTFERRGDAGFDPETVTSLLAVGSLVGPLLSLQRRVDSRPTERLRVWLHERIRPLRSPGYLREKMVAAAAVVLLLALTGLPGTHRIKAEATVEGLVQRAIVAGADGYVAEGQARAGDLVEQGQTLARLDDRDLMLERRRWEARASQLRHEYRNAVAHHDRSERRIVQARLDEARAQVALLDEQLARTRLVAPFDGIVVRGDLSQSLGAPVEKGDVLYELAPADGYRIIIEVDERDIAHVEPGRRGALALTALPHAAMPLEIRQITPVSIAEGGRNFFRVEASLDAPHGALRPGMEGVARIDVGRRQLLWIWTHELVDWLRLQTWTWLA
jgi:RND family efflux transporter MFP subunit